MPLPLPPVIPAEATGDFGGALLLLPPPPPLLLPLEPSPLKPGPLPSENTNRAGLLILLGAAAAAAGAAEETAATGAAGCAARLAAVAAATAAAAAAADAGTAAADATGCAGDSGLPSDVLLRLALNEFPLPPRRASVTDEHDDCLRSPLAAQHTYTNRSTRAPPLRPSAAAAAAAAIDG